MGFAFLWVEALTCALLVAALAAAQGARMRRRLTRWLLTAVADLPALALFVAMAGVSLWIYWGLNVLAWSVPTTLGLLVCYVAGLLWIDRRRKGRTGRTGPGEWSRGRLAAALGVMAGLGVLTSWHLDLSARQQADAIQAQAVAMGLALAPPRVPDEQNAAVDYQQAFEALRPPDDPQQFETWWETDRVDKWWSLLTADPCESDARDPNLASFLKRHELTLRLLRLGTGKPGCRFEHEYHAPSIRYREPEAREFSAAGGLLVLSARSQAVSGNVPGAVEDLRVAARMAEHAACTVEWLWRIWDIDEDIWHVLQWIVSSGTLTARQLAGLELHEASYYQWFRDHVLWMQQARRLGTYAAVADGQLLISELLRLRAPLWFEPDLPLYRILGLEEDIKAERELSEFYEQLADKPYHRARSQWQSLGNLLWNPPRGLLARICYGPESGLARGAAQADARRRVLQVALAACRYRAARGRWPDRAEELVGEFLIKVPVDPFDGKAIRCVRDGEGLIVYSIGRDFADNGGADWDSDKRTGDLAFHLPG